MPSSFVAQAVAWIIAKSIATLFLSVSVEGKENPKSIKKGAIFASNHASELDSILIRTALPLFSRHSPLFAVGRTSITYKWMGWRKYVYQDWFFKLLGAHAAPKGTRSYEKALKTFVELGKKGESILIFIGGRQYSENEPIKNRGGTAYLAHATGLPVIPVAVVGTFGMTRKKFLFSRKRVVIKFGTPKTRKELFKSAEPSVTECHAVSARIIADIDEMRNAHIA